MKTKFLIVSGILALIPGLTAQAQTAPAARHAEITAWVASPTGSHLGSGYADTYLTNIRAKTIGKEDPKLRNAVVSLDGLGMLPVKGIGLVPAAVAWQSQLPMRKVIEQQAETGLSYGELLVANSLASQSHHSLSDIVAMRAKSRTWGTLAQQLQVDPDLLVTRVNTASKRIVAVDFRVRRGRGRAPDPSFTANAPHYRAQHQ